MKGFVGSKEHACRECIPSDKGQLGSPVLVCLLLGLHRKWESGYGEGQDVLWEDG